MGGGVRRAESGVGKGERSEQGRRKRAHGESHGARGRQVWQRSGGAPSAENRPNARRVKETERRGRRGTGERASRERSGVRSESGTTSSAEMRRRDDNSPQKARKQERSADHFFCRGIGQLLRRCDGLGTALQDLGVRSFPLIFLFHPFPVLHPDMFRSLQPPT
jgi:hypothetical protein